MSGMSVRTSPWPPGVPCWADLTVPDVDAVLPFYEAVLGWTFAGGGPEYGGYVIGQVGETPAAGIGPQQPGAATAWTLYFASDDVEATAKAVTDSGGTLLLPPGDVGPLGRLCVAADPTGAVFGVWQAGQHIGAGHVNAPGGLTWEDLRSPDPATAQAFYTAVFGHVIDAMPEAAPDYGLFHLPHEQVPLGGMGPIFGRDDASAHWLVYFGVADTAGAVEAAQNAGGSVTNPLFESPYGRMAGLADPAGGRFWVVETDGSSQPDRSD